MQKLLMISIATGLIAFSGPAAVQAQTTAPATTTENAAQVDNDNDDDGFDLGWLGLLGLIGLAGLRGRNHHHDRTTSTVPR